MTIQNGKPRRHFRPQLPALALPALFLFFQQFGILQDRYARMFLEVSEVFVTADDIINGNVFGHRQEIEVFRVADVGLGFYGL